MRTTRANHIQSGAMTASVFRPYGEAPHLIQVPHAAISHPGASKPDIDWRLYLYRGSSWHKVWSRPAPAGVRCPVDRLLTSGPDPRPRSIPAMLAP